LSPPWFENQIFTPARPPAHSPIMSFSNAKWDFFFIIIIINKLFSGACSILA